MKLFTIQTEASATKLHSSSVLKRGDSGRLGYSESCLTSAGLAALSLFVILSDRYGVKQQHWAYATIGVLLGFWLKA